MNTPSQDDTGTSRGEPTRRSSDRRYYFLVAAIGAVAFSIEGWGLGPYSWMYPYGGRLETLPTHLALQYGDRLFSPWAPFVAGGVDRYAFWGNSDPLNLETLFTAFLPPWAAYGLHRLVQYFVAILGASLLARDTFELRRRDAALCGLLYAGFSYFTFGDMLALPALPLLLWILHQIRRRSGDVWPSLVAGLAFSTCTSFTHSVPYVALLLVLWTLLIPRDRSPRAGRVVAAVVLGMCLGDAPQLLAALAQAPLSSRQDLPPETLSWTLDGVLYRQLRFDYFNQDPLAKRIAWDLPLPLLTTGAIAVAVRGWMRSGVSRDERNLLVLYALYLLLSQRWAFVGAQIVLGQWLPWLNGIFMGRFFDVPASLLIALQLTLLQSIVRGWMSSIRLVAYAPTAACALVVAFLLIRPKFFLFYRLAVDDWGQFHYRVEALEPLRAADDEPFRVASVLPLSPAYAYAQGFETVDGWANLYSRYYRDYWLRVLDPLFVAVPGAKQIFAPETGRPQDGYIFLGADLVHPSVGLLPNEDPGLALTMGFDAERRFDLELLGLLNVKYVLSELPLAAPGLELVHAPETPPVHAYSRDWATGLLSPPSGPVGDSPLSRVQRAWIDWTHAVQRRRSGKDIFIYRLAHFIPRFRFIERLRYVPREDALLDALGDLSSHELSLIALTQRLPAEAEPAHFDATARIDEIERQHPDQITLRVTANHESFLAASISWSPYWWAEVDGRPQSPLRINHTQLGVAVPAGTRTIRLRYDPPYFPWSRPAAPEIADAAPEHGAPTRDPDAP